MNSSISSELNNENRLTPLTKKSDAVVCNVCGKGIWIPVNPDFEINHGFTCSYCGAHANFDFKETVVK